MEIRTFNKVRSFCERLFSKEVHSCILNVQVCKITFVKKSSDFSLGAEYGTTMKQPYDEKHWTLDKLVISIMKIKVRLYGDSVMLLMNTLYFKLIW